MWRQYRENALDKLRDAEILLKERRYTGAFESAFFAIEIGLKAQIVWNDPRLEGCLHRHEAERRGVPRSVAVGFFSHEIKAILRGAPYLEHELRRGCPMEYLLLCQLGAHADRWQPWKRYYFRADERTARMYYNLAYGL